MTRAADRPHSIPAAYHRSRAIPDDPRPRAPADERGAIAHAGGTLAYTVRRSARRRTVALQVGPAGVVVLAPSRYPAHRIADVVCSRALWLLRHLERIEASRPLPLGDGATVFMRGEPLSLKVEIDPLRVRPGIAESAGVLHAHLPPRMANGGAAVLGPVLRAYARSLAEQELPERLGGFARTLGRSAPRVLIREQKRRWGSCAQDGTIRLNWRLILLPPAFADYVCAHEAAHLLVMDHSPRFWAVVEQLVPAWRTRRAQLRREAGAYLALDQAVGPSPFEP